MKTSAALATALCCAAANLGVASAHAFIWGVYLNGVDQGTFNGIRTPAFNGPPPRGYANSPVKDLDSIDMRCNILGDKQVPFTIRAQPGDTLSLDWHHDNRSATDDIIDFSHHGPALAYISPDPPTENSFVKIWHKGLYEEQTAPLAPGKWAVTSDIRGNKGLMHVRIPAGLKAGHYLIRAELIALHEGESDYRVNPFRGAQFYPNCVQVEVLGSGAVELPQGVSFPGAYKYEDPGIVYDIYCSTDPRRTTPCTTTYPIPGPTVWSGAYAETTAVSVGPITGPTKYSPDWSSWIQQSVVTSATIIGGSPVVTATSRYTASWSIAYQPPPAATAAAAV